MAGLITVLAYRVCKIQFLWEYSWDLFIVLEKWVNSNKVNVTSLYYVLTSSKGHMNFWPMYLCKFKRKTISFALVFSNWQQMNQRIFLASVPCKMLVNASALHYCGSVIILQYWHDWWVLGKCFELNHIWFKALPFLLSFTWLLRLAPSFFFLYNPTLLYSKTFFFSTCQSSRHLRR